VAAAYREYRKKYKTRGGLVGPLAPCAIGHRRFDRLLGNPLYRDVKKFGAPGSEPELEIEFLVCGIRWTPMASIDELTRARRLVIWPLTMRHLT